MSKIGFALYAAHENGVTYDELASKLNLPLQWVMERVEAVRLCLGTPTEE